MRKNTFIKVIKGTVFFGVVLFLFGTREVGYAAGDEAEKEDIFYSEKYDITLYRHHLDQSGYCMLVNDIALTETQMEDVMNLSPDEMKAEIIKRSNILIRKVPSMRKVDASQVSIYFLQNIMVATDHTPYIMLVEFNDGIQQISVEASLYSVPEEIMTVWPEQPGDNVVPQPKAPPPVQPADRNEEPGEDLETKIIVPENEGYSSPGEGEMVTMFEEDTAAEIMIEKKKITDEVREEEDEGDETEILFEGKEKSHIGEYAYVATFSLSGVLSVIFGISIFLDFQAIHWYHKKRRERREKRKCRQQIS